MVGYCHVGVTDLEHPGWPTVQLIPPGGWWIATWTLLADPSRRVISVDMCTPPTFQADRWTYVDLELDPPSRSPGEVEVEDEDEFAEACASGLISPAEARTVADATAEVVVMLREQREPFGRVGWDRLESAMAMRLPPLTCLA